MNESRVFMLNGTEVSGIVTRLENFFRTEKGIDERIMTALRKKEKTQTALIDAVKANLEG